MHVSQNSEEVEGTVYKLRTIKNGDAASRRIHTHKIRGMHNWTQGSHFRCILQRMQFFYVHSVVRCLPVKCIL